MRPVTKFASSESVVATTRLASAAPARRSKSAVAPLPSSTWTSRLSESSAARAGSRSTRETS